MMLDLGLYLLGVGGIAVEYTVGAYDATFYLREPDFPAELRRLAALAPPDDLV